ncbi:hypothetical protein F4819DRAFT_504401 [Hypoxylon fuscum]|nr:hypothetical protein F4819DRAFT_504401 [Hypoxylon fuscum]
MSHLGSLPVLVRVPFPALARWQRRHQQPEYGCFEPEAERAILVLGAIGPISSFAVVGFYAQWQWTRRSRRLEIADLENGRATLVVQAAARAAVKELSTQVDRNPGISMQRVFLSQAAYDTGREAGTSIVTDLHRGAKSRSRISSVNVEEPAPAPEAP